MRKFIPNIIFTAILIAFVIQDHKEREALTPATDQLAPATYRGMLPAADCAGIDYTLTLNDSIAGTDTPIGPGTVTIPFTIPLVGA